MIHWKRQHLPVVVLLAFVATMSTAATCNTQVTKENSVEGKIAVYGIKISDGVKAISTAVRGLESAGTVPTLQAGQVIKITAQIQEHVLTLSEMLGSYDALTASAQSGEAGATLIAKIQTELNRIAALSTAILVPIGQEAAREQLATLVGTINQTLVNLSIELAKGVRS
jgi:hypothetical protein